MNIYAEIEKLQERVLKLETTQPTKEKDNASNHSMDNKDIPNGKSAKASVSTSRGLSSKKLKE